MNSSPQKKSGFGAIARCRNQRPTLRELITCTAILADSADDWVFLKGGGYVRGTIMSETPTVGVAIKLSDGSTRSIRHDEIEKVIHGTEPAQLRQQVPNPQPTADATVSGPVVNLKSDDAAATLDHVTGEAEFAGLTGTGWEMLCGVPCGTETDPAWKYRVGGINRPSSTFLLPTTHGAISLTVRSGSNIGMGLGGGIVFLGGVAVFMGTLVLAESHSGPEDSRAGAETFGLISPWVGIPVTVGGIGLMLKIQTDVYADGNRKMYMLALARLTAAA